MHILCYIAHLKFWARALVRSEFLKPLCFSLIPDGYVTAAEHIFDTLLVERFIKWLTSAFTPSTVTYPINKGGASAQVLLYGNFRLVALRVARRSEKSTVLFLPFLRNSMICN